MQLASEGYNRRMRARRIGTIIGVVVGVALCFGLGFGSGVIVQHSHSRKKEPKPIDPPAELSEVGKKVWELESGLRIVEENMWLLYGSCIGPLEELPNYASIAVSTELAMDRLCAFFSGEAEQYSDDPEYWFERLLFWDSISSFAFAGPAKLSEQESEREAEAAREKMSSFADSYAPIAYRFSRSLDPDTDEFARHVNDLRKLQPRNGFISLLAATAAAERGEFEETLSLIDGALTAENFSFPVAPLTEVIYDHWIVRKEAVPSTLICRYIVLDPIQPDYLEIRHTYKYIADEMSDEEFIAALPRLKRLVVRIARLKPAQGNIRGLVTCNLIRLLNKRAAEAYAGAGNAKGVQACLDITETHLLLQSAICDRSGHSERLEEMVKQHSFKSWRDLVGFSDYSRLQEFGDIEKFEHRLTRYEEFEYPPLEPQPGDDSESETDNDD